MAGAIGSMACRGLKCGEKVAVSQTAGGSLTCKCGFCGFSTYAQPGTKAAREIRAAMTPMDQAPATGSPDEPPKPAPRAAAGGFQLDQLTR